MLFSVPQYIDIEDKIAGPLTAKQLLWLFGMGASIFIIYATLPKLVFWILLFPVAVMFLMLTFYRPQGQPFYIFVANFIRFMFSPKIYVWQRIVEKKEKAASKKAVSKPTAAKKAISSEELADLARVLDNEGQARSNQIMEIVKKRQTKSVRQNQVKQAEPEIERKKTILTVTRKDNPKISNSSSKRVTLTGDSSKGRIVYMK